MRDTGLKAYKVRVRNYFAVNDSTVSMRKVLMNAIDLL
jgi:hypothetical protein